MTDTTDTDEPGKRKPGRPPKIKADELAERLKQPFDPDWVEEQQDNFHSGLTALAGALPRVLDSAHRFMCSIGYSKAASDDYKKAAEAWRLQNEIGDAVDDARATLNFGPILRHEIVQMAGTVQEFFGDEESAPLTGKNRTLLSRMGMMLALAYDLERLPSEMLKEKKIGGWDAVYRAMRTRKITPPPSGKRGTKATTDEEPPTDEPPTDEPSKKPPTDEPPTDEPSKKPPTDEPSKKPPTMNYDEEDPDKMRISPTAEAYAEAISDRNEAAWRAHELEADMGLVRGALRAEERARLEAEERIEELEANLEAAARERVDVAPSEVPVIENLEEVTLGPKPDDWEEISLDDLPEGEMMILVCTKRDGGLIIHRRIEWTTIMTARSPVTE